MFHKLWNFLFGSRQEPEDQIKKSETSDLNFQNRPVVPTKPATFSNNKTVNPTSVRKTPTRRQNQNTETTIVDDYLLASAINDSYNRTYYTPECSDCLSSSSSYDSGCSSDSSSSSCD